MIAHILKLVWRIDCNVEVGSARTVVLCPRKGRFVLSFERDEGLFKVMVSSSNREQNEL